MTEDARFEDADERPLRLKAENADDIPVISALLQDAICPVSEIRWETARRQFALLANRFRWEDRDRAERRNRPVERVQSLLIVDDVARVRTSGVPRDEGTLLSILAIEFAAGDDGTGQLEITLAGDGAFALSVECLNLRLQDVTRPYVAPSRKTPSHDP